MCFRQSFCFIDFIVYKHLFLEFLAIAIIAAFMIFCSGNSLLWFFVMSNRFYDFLLCQSFIMVFRSVESCLWCVVLSIVLWICVMSIAFIIVCSANRFMINCYFNRIYDFVFCQSLLWFFVLSIVYNFLGSYNV